MKRAALLSVSDRRGLVEFASALRELGFELLTTSGTGKALQEKGISSISIETYTGQQEIMDGRVKTLHPRIYAGLLARRDHPEDMRELEKERLLPIDVAAVNLYPFSANISSGKALSEMIELIDIGGPSMIRAASKNHQFVWPVIDPADYPLVLQYLAKGRDNDEALLMRRHLAGKVFSFLAHDTLQVGSYLLRDTASLQVSLSPQEPQNETALGYSSALFGIVGVKAQNLRYGENPHQQASFYRNFRQPAVSWEQLGGKELSYNNILDIDATRRMLEAFRGSKPAALIIKHLNPCGAAVADDQAEALRQAKRCDPRSHFGGIIGFNVQVTKETAEEVREDFAEVVLAPGFSGEALQVLRSSKNLRIIKLPLTGERAVEVRSAMGGFLVQDYDPGSSMLSEAEVVSARAPNDAERADLWLAWILAAHVKSNAIVVVKNNLLIGAGAGQMSRVDSVELALHKAGIHGHNLEGAVAASDAFFPFPDGLEALAQAGIKAVIAPKGAKRDDEVIAAANAKGISLLHVTDRHFRH